MATKFPLILNGVRFKVNPTSLHIQKALNFGTLQTQSGVKYQVWYNNPEVLTISGMSAGSTAFQELLFLKQNYDVTTSPGKTSQLFYKTKTYTGFITSLDVTHTTATHNKFMYNITFQLLQNQQFKPEDFALLPTGLLGTATTAFSQLVNEPIAGVEGQIDKLLGNL